MGKLTLDSPLTLALGKTASRRMREAGFETVRDLLYYSPRRYYTWGRLTDIARLQEGSDATLLVEVVKQTLVRNRSGNGVRLLVEVTDGRENLTCTFFAKNPYMLTPHQKLLKPGASVLVSGKISDYRGKRQMVQPEFEELEDTSSEAVARRAGRPIPIYRSVAGLASWKIAALIRSVLDRLDDSSVSTVIPQEVRQRYGLSASARALHALHLPEAQVDWEEAKRTLAWEEALILETALLSERYDATGASIRQAHPLTLSLAATMVDDLIADLPFELTWSQQQAWEEISTDLAQTAPMQRLLQADVGAGKTVVALLGMVAAVEAGYQAVLLAPTEVLARQHYRSLLSLLEKGGLTIPVHLLTGKRTGSERNATLTELAAGQPSITVGTHALIQEDVDIPQLALLVVDEQHRFGVAQREKLREGREWTPHLLVMTATPIPRTIAMTVFGDLDVTLMKGMPPGRQPVATHLVNNENQAWMDRMWQRAREEIDAGGRVYVVCPRIEGEETDDKDEADTEGGERSEQPSAPNKDAPRRISNDGKLRSATPPAPDDSLGANADLFSGQTSLFFAASTPAPGTGSGLGSPTEGNSTLNTRPPARPHLTTTAEEVEEGTAASALPAAERVVEELRSMPVFEDIRIGLAHGRQSAEENARVLTDFAAGDIPLLVATTVVEVGVDVPEATMMVVLGAGRFGLSQLHQLRGRVGRSDTPSVCLLTYSPTANPVTIERLRALESTTDGFVLAETDLRLRSEGDVLGRAQSGRYSGLRFLSVRTDGAVIAAARTVAQTILADDPTLKGHPALAAHVRSSVGDDVVWLERS